MICFYCGTENKESAIHCEFCVAPLKKKRPKMKESVYLEQCEWPFDELLLFHTYDLLVLLQLVREERTKAYNLLRTLQKANGDILIDSESLSFAKAK